MSLENDLLALVELPTWVPAGATEPDARTVASLVEDAVLPLLQRHSPDEVRRHPYGDVAVRFGPDTGNGLVLLTYVVAQHGDPDAGQATTIVGPAGRAVRGRGAAQCKGAMASALSAISRLDGRRDALRRPLWFAVNTEGSSSHDGSRRLLDDLAVRGRAAVALTGTDLRISRANRGRTDVVVRITGASSHSSQPALGDNPLDRLAEVLERLAATALPPPHPELGPASLTPFAIRTEPIAPHTIPAVVEVSVDRRLLPGESADDAVAEVAEALRPVRGVEVVGGRFMLPASVAPDDDIVAALSDGLRAAGRDPKITVSAHTFDAGYPCALGMPTPMFGPGRRQFGGELLAPEEVLVADCELAAIALATAVNRFCA